MGEQKKKLFTYAIIMLVAAVIIVLIAYMSENRVDIYEQQITKSESEVAASQAELVKLRDDNYELTKINEQYMTTASDFENYRVLLNTVKEAWDLHNAGDDEAAAKKLETLDRTTLDDTVGAFYDSVLSQINAE